MVQKDLLDEETGGLLQSFARKARRCRRLVQRLVVPNRDLEQVCEVLRQRLAAHLPHHRRILKEADRQVHGF